MTSRSMFETMAGLTLRPEGADDLDFLHRVYASTRREELAQMPWQDDQKAVYLNAQFEAQRRQFQEQHKDGRFDVIEQDGIAIGRLYVDRQADDIRVVDIALLPEYRSQGLGSGLLRALIDEAKTAGKSVSIKLEVYNPAQYLLAHLGFREKGEGSGVQRLMEWRDVPAG